MALGFWICAIFFGSALYAFAQTSPISGGIVQCANDPCTLCDIWILADRLTRFLLFNLMLPLAALMILIGGALLLTARDNQQQHAQGKAVFTYAIYGMIVAFAAWLIVSTLLATLGYKDTWYAFPDSSSCIAAPAAPPPST